MFFSLVINLGFFYILFQIKLGFIITGFYHYYTKQKRKKYKKICKGTNANA